MRKLEFIEPVAAMRGRLSAKQSPLVYAPDNNAAYYSPVGSVNPALNYQQCFIGHKRKRDGLTYYSVRCRSSVNMTGDTKLRMAASGAAFYYTAFILRTKDTPEWGSLYSDLMEILHLLHPHDPNITLRKGITEDMRNMFYFKDDSVNFAAGTHRVTIHNPFATGGPGDYLPMDPPYICKYWTLLAPQPITFNIQGVSTDSIFGLANAGDTFLDIKFSEINVLGIWTSNGVVTCNHKILLYNGIQVGENDPIVDGATYTLGD